MQIGRRQKRLRVTGHDLVQEQASEAMRSAQLRVALDREAGGAYCSQAQDLAVDVNVSCSLNLIPQAGLLLRALQLLRLAHDALIPRHPAAT